MEGRRARAVLGVPEHATAEEVRRAFRARALATHPDRGGDRTAFELVVLAFETLRHVDVRSSPRRNLSASRPTPPGQFCAYDSPKRARPRRSFDDVLRSAIERSRLAG